MVGGKCGEAGFLDGPMQYNRLDSPKNLGVSRKGVIYFFDSGNEYIRIIDLAGNVKTLQLGACKECKYLGMKLERGGSSKATRCGRSYATRTG